MTAKLFKGRKKAKWNSLSEMQEDKLLQLIHSKDEYDDDEMETEEVPKSLNKVSENLEKVPKNIEKVPENLKQVTQTLEIVDKVPEIGEHSDKVTENCEVLGQVSENGGVSDKVLENKTVQNTERVLKSDEKVPENDEIDQKVHESDEIDKKVPEIDLPCEEQVDRLSDDFLWIPKTSKKEEIVESETSNSTKSKSRRSTRRKSSLFNPVKRLKVVQSQVPEEKVCLCLLSLSLSFLLSLSF